jgi:hypothetical protein
MLAPSTAEIMFVVFHWTLVTSDWHTQITSPLFGATCTLPHIPTRHRAKYTTSGPLIDLSIDYHPITKLLWCQTNTCWPIVLQICKSNDNAFIELAYNFEALNRSIFCFRSILWRLVLFTVVYSPVIYSWWYALLCYMLRVALLRVTRCFATCYALLCYVLRVALLRFSCRFASRYV